MANKTATWIGAKHCSGLGRVLREVCEVTLEERNEVLEGDGKTVQIDESKIGKRKYHRGHIVEGQWVFGGIEEDAKELHR